MKIFNGNLTISRTQYGNGRKNIVLTVHDDDAVLQILECSISLENFAEALTGLARVNCVVELGEVEKAGKRKEHKKFEFQLPKNITTLNWKEVAKEELAKVLPEGWNSSGYFNAKDAFFLKDETDWVRTLIYRWVDKD